MLNLRLFLVILGSDVKQIRDSIDRNTKWVLTSTNISSGCSVEEGLAVAGVEVESSSISRWHVSDVDSQVGGVVLV